MATVLCASAGGTNVTSVDTSNDPLATANGQTFNVWVFYGNATDPADVFDNKGNTYIQRGKISRAGLTAYLYECQDGVGGAGHYATVDIGAAEYPSMHFTATDGALAASFDVVATAQPTAQPWGLNTGTLATDDEVIFSFVGHDGSGSVDIFTETTGFTKIGEINDSSAHWISALAVKAKASGSTAAVASEWTNDSGLGNCAFIMAAYKVSAGTSYTLPADTTSITETASDANLAMARVLLSSPATVTDTTSDANLARSLRLTADAASVVETASDASFTRGLAIGASSVEVNIGMPGAGLVRGHLFAADTAAVSLSASAADLWRNRAIVADTDAISVGVNDAGTLRTHIFAADTAAIAQTLPDSGLYRNRAVLAETNAIALAASDAQLIMPHEPLEADVANVAATVADAGLYRNPAVIAAPATIELTVRQTGADATIMPAETAPFAFTASDAALTRTILFAADSAGIAQAVTDVGLLRGFALEASASDIALAGQDAGLLRDLLLQADGASFATAMSDAMPANGRVLSADAANYAGLVSDAGLRKTNVLSADTAAFGQTTADAGFEKGRRMEASAATLSASGHANSLLTARVMPADMVAFSLSVAGVVDPPILTMGFPAVNYGMTLPDGAFARALRLVITPFALAFAEYGQTYTLHAEPAAYSFAPRSAGMNKGLFVTGEHAPVSLQARNANVLLHRRLRADVDTIRLNAAANTTFLTASRAAFSVGTPDAPISKYRGLIAQAVQFAEQANDANLARALRLIASTATFTLNTHEGGETPIYDGTMFETDFGSQLDTLSAEVVSEIMVLTA